MQASSKLNISVTLQRFTAVRTSLRIDSSPDAYWQRLVTLGRFATHIAVLGVLLVVGIVARYYSTASPSVDAGRTLNAAMTTAQSPRLVTYPAVSHLDVKNADGNVLIRQYVASTSPDAVKSRNGIISYTVQAGDTTEFIAKRFDLQPSSLIWSNEALLRAPDRLSIGQQILVPPAEGLMYEVQVDDTLSKIAETFKARLEDIIRTPVNHLNAGSNLIPGTQLFVPKGVRQITYNAIQLSDTQPASAALSRKAVLSQAIAPVSPVSAGGAFMWPTQGAITQGFFWGHGGLDIANAMGVPVLASDNGTVRYAGWDDTGYGWLVEIDHGNGFTTLYAHLNEFPVEVGQSVMRGQLIGLMGSSGRSTGPHTHFEIRYNGVPQNPLFYLP